MIETFFLSNRSFLVVGPVLVTPLHSSYLHTHSHLSQVSFPVFSLLKSQKLHMITSQNVSIPSQLPSVVEVKVSG